MSEYGGSSEVGTVEVSGRRALDDLLVAGVSAGSSGVPGWLLAQEDDDGVGEFLDSSVDPEVLREELVDFSYRYQLSVRGQVYASVTRGRPPVTGNVRGEMVDEKLFHCPLTEYLPSVEEGEVFAKLKRERVIANVVAKTGGGKSTRFPANVAVKCGMRVLFIVPDANLKELTGDRLSLILPPTRLWVEDKVAALVLLTPMEFLARFMGSGWYDLSKHFDCIIVDESHMPNAFMYAIRSVVVSKDIGGVSVLFLTATTGKADVQTVVEPQYVEEVMEEVFEKPDFVDGPYAVDGTLVLVESDERVRNVGQILAQHGLDVYTLESSAGVPAIKSVCTRMAAASATMRFLVAHEKFGVSHNLPVSRVLTTGTTSVLVERDGEWFYGPSLLSKVEIAQQMGRVGRSIVSEARRGVVFAPEHMIPAYRSLRKSEYFTAYVILVAMNIRPRSLIADSVVEELPFGLTPRVAAGLLTLPCVPPRLAVRMLDGDARFPIRFFSGLKQFSVIGGLSPIGSDADPVGYAAWRSVSLREVLGCGPDVSVGIPVKASGELEVMLVLMSAAAGGVFKPRPTYEVEMSGYESGPDSGKSGVKVVRQRRVLPAVYPVVPLVEDVEEKVIEGSFSLEVPLADQPGYGRRMGGIVPSIVTNHLASGGYAVGVPEVVEKVSTSGRPYVVLDFPGSPVNLRSPGGSVSFTVGKEVWVEMAAGRALSVELFKRLMRRVGENVDKFAACNAFSVWGNPWLSMLRTFEDEGVLRYVVSLNASAWLVSFLAGLWARYVNAMDMAVLDSHQVANFWKDLVDRFSTGFGRRHVRSGSSASGGSSSGFSKVPRVAQSEAFHERLYAIREGFSRVLLVMEREGMFDPARVAEIQRILPISRRMATVPLHDGIRTGKVREWDVGELKRLKDRMRKR